MRASTLTTSGASTSAVFKPDIHTTPFNIGLGLVVTGTVSVTVEHTFDDVFAATFNPSTATWFPHATLAAETTNQDGNYAYPVRGIRANQASGAGSSVLTIVQAGRTG